MQVMNSYINPKRIRENLERFFVQKTCTIMVRYNSTKT